MARKRTLAQRRAEFRANAAKYKKQERKKNIKRTAKSVGKALATEAAMAAVPALRLGKVAKIAAKAVKSKKVKGLKKSPARKKAEAGVKKAESTRKAAKQFVNKDSQKMSRSPKKQAKEFVAESRKRRNKASHKAMKEMAAAKTKQVKAVTPDAVKLSKKQGSKFIQESNKRVVQARKKLAATPRYGGKYTTGSSQTTAAGNALKGTKRPKKGYSKPRVLSGPEAKVQKGKRTLKRLREQKAAIQKHSVREGSKPSAHTARIDSQIKTKMKHQVKRIKRAGAASNRNQFLNPKKSKR